MELKDTPLTLAYHTRVRIVKHVNARGDNKMEKTIRIVFDALKSKWNVVGGDSGIVYASSKSKDKAKKIQKQLVEFDPYAGGVLD